MQNDCLTPDGKFLLQFESSEVKMSHWICSPRLTRVEGGAPLFDLWGTLWDADARFERELLLLELRKYPGDRPNLRISIDPRLGTFAFAETPWRTESLAQLLPVLERQVGSG